MNALLLLLALVGVHPDYDLFGDPRPAMPMSAPAVPQPFSVAQAIQQSTNLQQQQQNQNVQVQQRTRIRRGRRG